MEPPLHNPEATELMIHYIVHRYLAFDFFYEQWLRELWWYKYRENLNLVKTPIIETCEYIIKNLERLKVWYYSDKLTDEDYIRALNNIIKECKN